MALETSVEQASGRVPITVAVARRRAGRVQLQALIDQVRGLYEAGSAPPPARPDRPAVHGQLGLVALHSIVRLMHGEPPPDPEAGWGALHALGQDVAEGSTQAEVQLCGAQPAVERVLARTGLNRLFLAHPDRAPRSPRSEPSAIAAGPPCGRRVRALPPGGPGVEADPRAVSAGRAVALDRDSRRLGDPGRRDLPGRRRRPTA